MIAMTAPHFAATEAGLEILEAGGTAVEAMVAAAATIAVVYPHMNGLGGDGFWIISEPGRAPIAIDASGCAAQLATPRFYSGEDAIPSRGAAAALSMAGAVSGWQLALQETQGWQSALPLSTLLGNAIKHAKHGFKVTQSLQDASEKTFPEFSEFEAFAVFTNNGTPLKKNDDLKLNNLANTFEHLVRTGLGDFYQGELAHTLSENLQACGSPIRIKDFNQYHAKKVSPLSLAFSSGQLFNLPEPTQGVASLIILGLFDRLKHHAKTEADFIHIFVECTKKAFLVRNEQVTDSSRISNPLSQFLANDYLDDLAKDIDLNSASPWPYPAKQGDTIWMGACDSQGRMVSYIQSLYWEFGSGVVCKDTGIVWNNRGTSFSLDEKSKQYLQPGLKPFHTLNPAYAEFNDGSRMVYGTMGGEGQPQTQGTLFCRHVWQQQSLQQAISHPRWLLGRTWGDVSHNLKIEDNMSAQTLSALQQRGHDVALVPQHSEMMGHAGAIKLTTDSVEAASDPRSDGLALVKGNIE